MVDGINRCVHGCSTFRPDWIPSSRGGGRAGGVPTMSLWAHSQSQNKTKSGVKFEGTRISPISRPYSPVSRVAACGDNYESWTGNNPDVRAILVGETECAGIVWHSQFALSCEMPVSAPSDSARTVSVILRDGRSNEIDAARLGRIWVT